MPKIICPVCEGTLDANHDLPASEYVHYPCQSCKNGIKNYCKKCDGVGTYWTYGRGDCGVMHHCKECDMTGYERSFIELEIECPRCKDDPPAKHPQGQAFDNIDDLFEAFAMDKIDFVCAKCNGTKKVIKKFYEGSTEYDRYKRNNFDFSI